MFDHTGTIPPRINGSFHINRIYHGAYEVIEFIYYVKTEGLKTSCCQNPNGNEKPLTVARQ
jgi:hypothetical protein